MKVFHLFLVALFLLILLEGCTGTTELTNTDLIISGKWNWIKSEGWPYSTTPEQAGYTKQILFDISGTYYEYRNNSIFQKASYRIVAKDINSDKLNESIIVIDDLYLEYIVESFQDDTLLLRIINCADCRDKEYYTKVR